MMAIAWEQKMKQRQPIVSLVISFVAGFYPWVAVAEEKAAAPILTNKSALPEQAVFPMLLGLLAMVALILFLAFLLKKVTGGNFSSSQIKVVESQALGAKERLVIIEIQGEQHLLGVTPHTINQLFKLDKPIQKNQHQLSFDAMLRQILPGKASQTPKAQSATEESSS